jgi:hypothetical protein
MAAVGQPFLRVEERTAVRLPESVAQCRVTISGHYLHDKC